MRILSIDLGSYSVKFTISTLERRVLTHEHTEMVPLEEAPDRNTLEDMQLATIQRYLQANPFEGKKIFQLPLKYLTFRYTTLPVTNKKKAEALLSFQLDRELPFPVQECLVTTHYSVLEKKSLYGISSIVEIKKFDPFFKKCEQRGILPDVLASEATLYQNIVTQKQWDEPLCILDIGHETTKAYIFNDQKLVAQHISFVAGKVITENIAEYYRISTKEAQEFKHTNSFFLTDFQLSQVDAEQREFGTLIKEIFSPLVRDVQKWDLGHRVNFGENIRHLYLCGGSSQIKNMAPFFSQALSLKTEILDLEENEQNKSLHLTHLMATSFLPKNGVPNFRIGNYAASGGDELPLYSGVFLGGRILAISLLLLLTLFMERVFLFSKGRMLDQKNVTILKREDLKIAKKDQRNYMTVPDNVLKTLSKINKTNESEILLLKAGSNENAITHLLAMNKMLIPDPKWTLISFESRANRVWATFKYDDPKMLSLLKDSFKSYPYGEVKLVENPSGQMLNIEIVGQNDE